MLANYKEKLSIRELCKIGLCVALMVLGSKISIPLPFHPVPFTLQNIFALLCGLLLMPFSSFLTMGVYLLLGLCGLPVFSGGGGFAYILQPSFGYLIGFLFAAPCLSFLRQKFSNDYFASFMATLIIHLSGSLYFLMINSLVLNNPQSFTIVLSMFTLYFPLDLIKLIISVSFAKRIRPAIAYL